MLGIIYVFHFVYIVQLRTMNWRGKKQGTCSSDLENEVLYKYPPKGRWIVVDIYRDAKRRGMYRPLFTDPERVVVLVFTKSDG